MDKTPADHAREWARRTLDQVNAGYAEAVDTLRPTIAEPAAQMADATRGAATTAWRDAERYVQVANAHFHAADERVFRYTRDALKQGLGHVANHPDAAVAVATLGLVASMPITRSFVLRNTLGRLRSDEGRLRALERRARNLTEDHIVRKKDEEKLLTRLSNASDEYRRARSKLEAAAVQVRALEQRSASAEATAAQLAAELRVAPSREAALLRADVGKVAKDILRQRSAVTRRIEGLYGYGVYA